MPVVLEFPAHKFVEAQKEALDSANDLVVVNDLVEITGNFEADTRRFGEVMQAQTPIIEEFWRTNRVVGYDRFLAPKLTTVFSRSIGLHLDRPNHAGYVASANLSSQDRQFYAERYSATNLIKADKHFDHSAWERALADLSDASMHEPDWTTIRPGSVALFGALPWLAAHAAQGNTHHVALFGWCPVNTAYEANLPLRQP